jgi:hypothetical protein
LTAAPNNVISAHPDFQNTLEFKDKSQIHSPLHSRKGRQQGVMVENGTQTGILFGIPKSAMCVQRFDDSLIMQVTILIAIRYVLHRCVSQEIHCQKLYVFFLQDSTQKRDKPGKATLRHINNKVFYSLFKAAQRKNKLRTKSATSPPPTISRL